MWPFLQVGRTTCTCQALAGGDDLSAKGMKGKAVSTDAIGEVLENGLQNADNRPQEDSLFSG